jgi:hypothetical protein
MGGDRKFLWERGFCFARDGVPALTDRAISCRPSGPEAALMGTLLEVPDVIDEELVVEIAVAGDREAPSQGDLVFLADDPR